MPQFIQLFSKLAREHEIYIVAGTIQVFDPDRDKDLQRLAFFSPSGAHGVQGEMHMTRFEAEEWDICRGSA
ncbi:MAG: hypothetical protein ABIR71_00565 [Chthoniobacterales bacterium]